MKTALFIDGANLYATSKAIDLVIDYQRLLTVFDGMHRAFYYTAILEGESNLIPLVDWLSYNNYTVVKKFAKTFTKIDRVSGISSTVTKGNMDIEIAVDAMELADRIDHLVLFSGDGDFTALVLALQRKGLRVTIVSELQMCADELRRAADEFIPLSDLRSKLERTEDKPLTPKHTRSKYASPS